MAAAPTPSDVRPPRPPQREDLERIAAMYRFDLGPGELELFQEMLHGVMAAYRRLDQLPEPRLPVKYPRTPGYRPPPADNPLNAWYWRCSIEGAPAGPLAGKRVAIKDNVCVAGVPMMNGSSVLEGFVPDEDATIVTRILDAGGEIVGKAVCEHLCISGGSHTSDTGPVLNPHDPRRTAGGSSSGSTALVVAGHCDLAIGGDQAGSIRIPASFSGAVGLKPTYGLVPYTGVFPIEVTLDHVGPIARTAADCALLLEAIAGPDGLDSRQSLASSHYRYTEELQAGARGLRVGVVREGFRWPEVSEPEVDASVREAAERLSKAGADVADVSVPLHRDGAIIRNVIAAEGATALMIAGNATGTNWKGHYLTQLGDFFGRSRQVRGRDFSDMVKVVTLTGQYMRERYQGRYYAKAQNLARVLRAAYDDAFRSFDLLVMPTTPMKAPLLPGPETERRERMLRAREMIGNTAPFNVTGHPAVSVPCGTSEQLPVGLMAVGRWGEDGLVLRAARAVEVTR